MNIFKGTYLFGFLAPYYRIGDDATMDPGFLDPSRSTVDYCSSNQGAFFGDFVAAMSKLGRIGVKTPATGVEMPRDCRFPN